STIRYKKTQKLEDEIAKELGVRYLLRGSLALRGDDLTIRFRLVDPYEQSDVINRDYDKSKRDLSKVRSEILRQVVSLFESQVEGEHVPTPEAYEHYMSGLEYDRKERKEDNQLAIAELTQAIEKDPNFIQAYIKLAGTQLLNHEAGYDLNEKWLNEAEKNIRKVLSIDSTNAEGYWLLGRLKIERGERKEGVEVLERVINMEQNPIRAYVTLSNEYLLNMNDPAKAITILTKAYEIEPTHYNISINMGIGFAMLKKYDEAVEAFRRSSTQNPEHELPWINLAYLYEILGKQDSALTSYENAIKLNPANPITTEYLSILLINKKKYERAESTLIACLQFEPSNYRLIYTLGMTKMYRSQPDAAKKVWKDGQKLAEENSKFNPNVSEHYYYLGLFCSRLNENEKAILFAKKAVQIDSSEQNVMGVARVYSILKNKDELISWFAKAKAMNPEYDVSFIQNDIDLQSYKTDQDLITAARR
ncbi:MAG: tetratricopeptide repeat protein, partial [Ignavibacteriae bacterium]|nr:tetratricopeptide repeat protein [Ignavibacteriota bacterium]